nr:reverse transcriptase domain-containing protein [Tanacetum cinerariifolium]
QVQEDPPEDPPEVLMADNRTMAGLLQAPTEGYDDAIVILEIAANDFELKHGLINLVQNKQFFGHDKEDPHAHIRYFNKITSTMRVPNVSSSSIKLMLFPFSLEGAAWIWLEKEPPRSILTWDDLVTKFISQFFPPSKTKNLRNEITRFQQRFDKSFYEAWDCFNDFLGHDSLNSAAGGNFLDKMPRECLKIIKSESKDMVKALLLDKKNQSSAPAPSPSPTPAPVKAVEPNYITCGGAHSYQNCPVTSENVYRDNIQEYMSQAAAANYNQGNTSFRPQMVANQIQPLGFPPVQTHQNIQNNFNRGNNFNQNRGAYQAPAYQALIPQTQSVSKTNFESYVKANDAVLRNMQNQGQNLQIQMANLTDMQSKFPSSNTASSSGSVTLPSNTITNPKKDLKGITTQSSVAYQGPTIPTPSKVMKQGTEVTKDQVQTPSSQSTAPVQPLTIQSKTQTSVSEPVVAPVSAPMPNLKPSIPYPLRRDNERRCDQANEQIEKFYEIFKDMSFEISFTDALILMPKFASTLKALIGNKKKLIEMDRTPMNEHCSVVILNKLPRKLGDPDKFLIPCEFPRMDECLALADLGASINLMPLSMWEGLSLSKLTPTCMTLKLEDRSVFKPIGIAKDVSVKVCVFYFLADFMVVDFKPDSRVPLILRRYSANYNHITANKIDVIDMACEEYSQEVLGFFDVTASGNPTPYDDLIVSITSPTLTSFGDSDFLLFEEANAFLELKVCEAKTVKSFVDKPPEVELKDLPPHLEYAFLEGDNKLSFLIAKELGDEEKSALIKVLKSHKRAIAWKLSDIQGINPEFCTHKILIEEDYKPEVSPVHCVPKKGGFTVVENEENELIPTRLVTRWRVCIDYRKLNEATRKDHFPPPFMD